MHSHLIKILNQPTIGPIMQHRHTHTLT